jgi:acylphosphatase
MQAHILVMGFVQGIGFRSFVKSKAQKLGLTGWVRNTDDGRVEILAQGKKEKLEQLVKLCEKGPFLSEVKSVQVQWEKEKEQLQSFEIIR